MTERTHIELLFTGRALDRATFLRQARQAVTFVTGEVMTLDVLTSEAVKNIYDHAGGVGSLRLARFDDVVAFDISDAMPEAYDFELLRGTSTKRGNGVNAGTGLAMIEEVARTFAMDLRIDTTHGFRYTGVYITGTSPR